MPGSKSYLMIVRSFLTMEDRLDADVVKAAAGSIAPHVPFYDLLRPRKVDKTLFPLE